MWSIIYQNNNLYICTYVCISKYMAYIPPIGRFSSNWLKCNAKCILIIYTFTLGELSNRNNYYIISYMFNSKYQIIIIMMPHKYEGGDVKVKWNVMIEMNLGKSCLISSTSDLWKFMEMIRIRINPRPPSEFCAL